ncbi:hypothetical protein WDU99_01890 [Microbacterium sp. Mu-80]|uniref:DUF1640 domain-containing protein n=1 Tax=Microbacterium bandirmense TaxID=3122050 RepID=A0ABU8L8E6_9MICO
MEPDIREALSDIKTDVRDGFKGVNERIDNMVTKGEFTATVARLDAQHETLRRDFSAHDTEAATRATQARADDQAVRAELRTELDGFRVTTRWAIGLSVAGAGVLYTIVSLVVTTLIP